MAQFGPFRPLPAMPITLNPDQTDLTGRVWSSFHFLVAITIPPPAGEGRRPWNP